MGNLLSGRVKRGLTLGFASASAWALAACSPALNWREARPTESLFLMFPCKPMVQTRTLSLAGQSVAMSMHACEVGPVTYALAHADVVDPARSAQALRELRAALSNKLRGNSQSRPWVVPGGTPNAASGRWHVAGVLPDGRRMEQDAAFFVKGTRVFQMVVMGPALTGEATDPFFESVKLPS